MTNEKKINLNHLIDDNIVFPIKRRFNNIIESVDNLNDKTTEHFSSLEEQMQDNKNLFSKEVRILEQKNVELSEKIRNLIQIENKHNMELLNSISSIKWEFI